MAYADYYILIETGIIDRLFWSMPEFFKKDWQVSNNDYNIQLGGDYFVVARPGKFPALPASYKSGEVQDVAWDVYLHLYVKIFEKGEMWSLFNPLRSKVVYHLMKNRFLDAVTINDHFIVQVPGVDRIRSVEATEDAGFWSFFTVDKNQPPNFMYQPIRAVIHQRVRFD